VQITKPFYLGIHEVTQKQYQDVTGFNPSHFSQQGPGKEAVQGTETSQLPVESETWFEAIDFCIQLSEREQLPPYYRHDGELVAILGGIGYRLPTEAEWEYACRAGTAACWSFGPDPEQLAQHAWFKSNSSSQTHPTGELMANPFGLFDMYGNAWEWCWDVFAEYPLSAASDPTGPEVGKGHVLRGGAFHDEPSYVRSASRGWNVPDKRNNSYGFRVARDCPDTR
jgi:formylglycine-generating enzyme required for sulfatase activity